MAGGSHTAVRYERLRLIRLPKLVEREHTGPGQTVDEYSSQLGRPDLYRTGHFGGIGLLLLDVPFPLLTRRLCVCPLLRSFGAILLTRGLHRQPLLLRLKAPLFALVQQLLML